MNTTTVIITLGGLSVATAIASKIAGAIGEVDIANYIKVAGVSGAGITAIGLVYKLLGMLKGF